MSASIFHYFINADKSDLEDMQINIDAQVQERWRHQKSVTKFDDLGDSLLHALNDILCGSSNFRQLLPSTHALHKKRCIILQIMPSQVFYVVLHCSWNVVTIEYFGAYDVDLTSMTFHDESTTNAIRTSFTGQLRAALTHHSANGAFLEVDEILIVVKMLKGYDRYISFLYFNRLLHSHDLAVYWMYLGLHSLRIVVVCS